MWQNSRFAIAEFDFDLMASPSPVPSQVFVFFNIIISQINFKTLSLFSVHTVENPRWRGLTQFGGGYIVPL